MQHLPLVLILAVPPTKFASVQLPGSSMLKPRDETYLSWPIFGYETVNNRPPHRTSLALGYSASFSH